MVYYLYSSLEFEYKKIHEIDSNYTIIIEGEKIEICNWTLERQHENFYSSSWGFLVAIILALIVTVINSVFKVQILAITLISPLIILNIVFIIIVEKGKSGVMPELQF